MSTLHDEGSSFGPHSMGLAKGLIQTFATQASAAVVRMVWN